MLFDDPTALQSILVLLNFGDDLVTVRFLVVRPPTSSEGSWMNPLLITLCDAADVSFNLYTIVSDLFTVQLNSAVAPATTATETGSTTKTIQNWMR